MSGVQSFCTSTANVWQFVGYFLFIFKIVIPLLLIILGMIDLGKAVVSNDDKEVKNATSKLAKRAVAGVVIFFIPTLVGFIFNIVGGFSDVKSTYDGCKSCIVNPLGSNCKTWADAANKGQ